MAPYPVWPAVANRRAMVEGMMWALGPPLKVVFAAVKLNLAKVSRMDRASGSLVLCLKKRELKQMC